MKKCPYCAEEIQDEAVKCRYCHELLNEPKKQAKIVVVGVLTGKKSELPLQRETIQAFCDSSNLTLTDFVLAGLLGDHYLRLHPEIDGLVFPDFGSMGRADRNYWNNISRKHVKIVYSAQGDGNDPSVGGIPVADLLEESRKPRATKTKSKSFGWGLTIIMILIAVGLIGLFLLQVGSLPSSSSSEATLTGQTADDIKKEIRATIRRNMNIKNLTWHKGGFDAVMMVNATIENASERDAKDIELTCEIYSNSGTRIDTTKRVAYETIKAGKSKRIRDFNMGFIHNQAASVNCTITDVVLP